ncbi:uncharacterized protein map3k19 [Trichomycterus rosablanca]|uniref:uncharacterized protein map3k19 n=1 Tax=Trichomycterus rosablanca TaxID=2290929 RepID=UPI002F35B637
MEKTESRLVDLLLMGELEAANRGLEEGVYSWEELDRPHNVEGNTPLISACQMGLSMVMHFLLDRGADPTLCNHSNQTALHLSQPSLQGEMLAAITKPFPHCTQLLKAAWTGDIHALQHLLSKTDSLDVNIQNQNGLTPLMLAVRDVDLFEGLQGTKGWDYNSIGVVKELLALSANVDLQDQKGYDVLHYISQIRSFIKEELLRIVLVSRSQSDKIIVFRFQSATEPRMSARQDLYKATGWTKSLPSLREKDKSWTMPGTMHPTFDVPIQTSLAAQSPRLTKKNKTVMETPSKPRLSQLSQSAPSLALLDASFLLQVRANISSRLSGEKNCNFNRQDGLPVLCRRAPKHLAPLDKGYSNGLMLSSLEQPVPPDPTSILPLGSRQRKKSYSRQTTRGSRAMRKGSEESNSSSGSSQSSLEEEEDEEDISPGRTGEVISTLRREPVMPRSQSSFQASKTSIKSNKDKPITCTFKKSQVEADLTHDTTGFSEELNHFERTFSPQEQYDDHVHINVNEHRNVEAKDRHAAKEGKSNFVDIKNKEISPPLNIMLHPNPVKTSRASKMTKRKERKCRSAQTNQSSNLSANVNTSREIKPIRNPLPQVIVRKMYLIDDIGGENNKLDLPNMAPTIQDQNLKDTIINQETLHYIKSSGAKKTLRNSKNQKQQLNREVKQRESKKTGILGTQRAKSSLDHVSYRDMFLEIPQEAEGPAICEMFATPLYEKLRVSSSAERNKQIRSAPPVNRKLNRQQRVQKSLEGYRKKRPQKCTNAKGKLLKNGPQNQRQMVISAIEVKRPISSCKILSINDKVTPFPGLQVKTQSGQMLSLIEEVLSETGTNTPIHNQPADLSISFHSLRAPCLDTNISQKQKTGDLKDNGDASSGNEDSVVGEFPGQPLINTWTSNRTQSPVYQKFLDDVGDGPVTDDLLRCLAEELISLEDKEVESLKTETPEMKFANANPSEVKHVKMSSIVLNILSNERSSVNDTIIWTKGEILGRGAYGTVYCGLTNQGQLIAVKQVTLDVSNSETTEKEYNMLEQEVDLLKNLEHPNIVGFLGTALSGNIISILMEYIPGGSISNVLSRFGPLPEKVFALYTTQIVEGVYYLHANRVIHRDLKGNNIMLMPSGIIKLIDFGCARRLNFQTHSGSRSDLLKSVHGTPYWMAPEVINETGHGKKSDIWSIGCTIFEMATGKPPLANMGKMAALFYIGAQKGSMPSLPDEFTEEAKGFVKACLINEQEQRPSAADLLRHPFINKQQKNSKPSTKPNHLAN